MTNMLLRKGQVIIEYFILFAVVAVLTVLGLTQFDDDLKTTLQDFYDAAATNISQ